MSQSSRAGHAPPGQVSVRVALFGLPAALAAELRRALEEDPELELVSLFPAAAPLPALQALSPQVIVLGTQNQSAPLWQVVQLTEALPDSRILLVGGGDDESHRLAWIRAGSAGHLDPEEPPADLSRAIKAVARGRVLLGGQDLSPAEARQWALERLRAQGLSERDLRSRSQPLTSRQLEILQCMADGQKNEAIARDLGLSHQTVKNQVHSLYCKLGTHDRTRSVVEAVRLGWVRAPQGSQIGGMQSWLHELGPSGLHSLAHELEERLAQLPEGAHVGQIYASDAERLALSALFLKLAVRHGRRGLYAGPEMAVGELRDALGSLQVDVADARERAALLLCPVEALFPTELGDEPALLSQALERELEQARDEGFDGLHLVLEGSWLAAAGQLLEFEASLQQAVGTRPVRLLCQFSAQGLPLELTLAVLRTHAWMAVAEHLTQNPFCEPPQLAGSPGDGALRVGWMLHMLQLKAQAEEGQEEAFHAERRRRLEAESVRRQLGFLAEASVLLHSSPDYEGTLEALARLATREIADWCVIDLIGPDRRLRRLVTAHVDPAKEELVRVLQHRYPSDPARPQPIRQVVERGRPELYQEVPPRLLEEVARDAEHLQALRALGLRSLMIVPLATEGEILGALALATAESRRTYGLQDLVLAEELAQRAALALQAYRVPVQ